MNKSEDRSASRRAFLRYAAGATTAVIALHAKTLHGFGASPETLHVTSIPGRPIPILLGQKKGFFAKHELEVQVEAASTSEALRGALANGQADIAHGAVDNAVAMVENAGADVVIIMGGEASANELIAQSDIHSIPELRGRTLLVDAPNTAYALQLKKILLDNGLRAGSDYQLVPFGATPQRLQAMRDNKQYAASILGPPTSIVAKRAGFVSLGSTNTLIGPYQAIGAFTRRSWARDHSVTVVKYLAAYFEAQQQILDPALRSDVLDLLKQEWRLEEPALSETYALLQTRAWYEPDARFDVDGFKTVLRLRAEIEGQWNGKPPTPDKYCDFSYYKQALSMIMPHGQ